MQEFSRIFFYSEQVKYAANDDGKVTRKYKYY